MKQNGRREHAQITGTGQRTGRILLRGLKVVDLGREDKCMVCVPIKAYRLRLEMSSRNASADPRLNDQTLKHINDYA